MERGGFRADLFYRLNVIPVTLPPLRDRREDIPMLVEHFLKESCRCAERAVVPIDEDALGALCRYDWPGNVRELENVIERVVILEEGDRIQLQSLPERIAHGAAPRARCASRGARWTRATRGNAGRHRARLSDQGSRRDRLAEEEGLHDPRDQFLHALPQDPALRPRAEDGGCGWR